MARITMDGIDEAIRALELTAEQIAERAPMAVMAGAKVLQKTMSANAPNRTGQLAKSIYIKTGYNVEDGCYAEVYPKGNRRDGERNGTVGFVLEYGRKNMQARKWMKHSLDASEGTIAQVMLDVLRG